MSATPLTALLDMDFPERLVQLRKARSFTQRHLGELIEAEVVPARPETDAEELRDFCRSHLAAFKVPTEIHLVPAVARTAVTGKILRPAATSVHD